MKQDKRIAKSHRQYSIFSFFVFFGLFSLLIAGSFLIFFRFIRLNPEQIRAAAPGTLVNVLVLSLLCSLFDHLRRVRHIDRPVARILDATNRVAAGDFSVRLEELPASPGLEAWESIAENFNKMAEELSGIETLRTDFISNVSHELKTPLSAIQNYATLLQDPTLNEAQRTEYAKEVSRAAHRLSGLVTNILKLNKLENQQIYPEAHAYNLAEQLRGCLLRFEDAWEQKELEIDADAIDEVLLTADSELLSLVWNNLLSNAIKFTPNGGKITVGLYENQGAAVVTVSDTGCGISPEAGRHIFEKFYQGDTSHAVQGNGLGLALVKRVVDIMQGEIRVESAPGKGTTFTVRIPNAVLLSEGGKDYAKQ